MTTGLEHVAKQRRSTQVITPMIACELRGIIIHIHESKLFCCELQGIPWFLTHQHPATIYIYIYSHPQNDTSWSILTAYSNLIMFYIIQPIFWVTATIYPVVICYRATVQMARLLR